ncbi:MAG: ferredoxin reductase [Marmoricola sp.]
MPSTAPAPQLFLRDRVTRIAEALTTPLLPADYLDMFSPLRSGADLRGRIESIHPETRDSATLVIRPGRGWRPHTPGQYVRIGIDVDGVRRWRTYSLTSDLSRTDGCTSVTVKAIPDGVVSNHLVRRTRPGTVVQLDQATGEFVLPQQVPAKLLFLTAGSGVTPVMGMLRNVLSAGRAASASERVETRVEPTPDIVVLHSAPTPDDVMFGGELRLLAKTGRITLVERHTDLDGMLATSELADLVPDLAERETWACGPTALLDAVEKHFADLGLPDALHTERFRPVVHDVGEGGSVTYSRTGAVVETDGATTLLDAGEQAGVLMPSGCRMGVCFGCVLPLKQGSVRDLRNGEVTTAEPDQGSGGVHVQTCVSAAAGACDLDI